MSTAGVYQEQQGRLRKTRLELLAERELDEGTQRARIGGVGTGSASSKVARTYEQTSSRAVSPPPPSSIPSGQQGEPSVQPMALSVENAARLIGLSRSTVWVLVRRGDLPAKRLGNRVLLRMSDLAAFVEALPDYVHDAGSKL